MGNHENQPRRAPTGPDGPAPLAGISQAFLDVLHAALAALDPQGRIVAVNRCWREFGDANGLRQADACVGCNYLEVCDAAAAQGSPQAREVAAALRAILAGTLPRFSIEYPCDSPQVSRWFLLQAAPLAGQPPQGATVMHVDISARRHAEIALLATNQRFERQRQALIGLTRSVGTGAAALERVTEAAAAALEVARASIWLYTPEGDAIVAEDVFEARPNRHSRGASLRAQDYPAYFAALLSHDVIAAHDALHDPRTAEFRSGYLEPLGIVSMLDAPIIVGGRRRGVLCLEQVGSARRWTPDEENFAVALSNLAALAMEQEERARAQVAARALQQRFEAVARATTDAIWDWDLATNGLYWAEGMRNLFGFESSELEPGLESWTSRVHPDDHDRVLASLNRMLDDPDRSEWSGEYRFQRKDGSFALVLDRGVVVRDAGGRAVRMLGGMADITRQRQAEADTRESQSRFRELAENIDEAFWLHDLQQQRIVYVSPAYERIWGRTSASLYAAGDAWLDAVHEDDRERVRGAAAGALHSGTYQEEYRVVRPDGTVRWVRDRAFPIRDESGTLQRIGGIAVDITEHKQAALEMARVNRALEMLSACNEALIRTTDEQRLLAEICRIAVEIGGYRMAWVGYVRHDAARTLAPVAHAGLGGERLAKTRISWSADDPAGQGPAARAVRSGRATVSADVLADPAFAAFRQAVVELGYRSTVALPLLGAEGVLGVLSLFGDRVATVSADEIRLLKELADNFAFGIGSLRSAQHACQLQDAVTRIAQGVSGAGAADFFGLLASSLAAALDADAALVGRTDPRVDTVMPLAAVAGGQPHELAPFPLAGTPAAVLEDGQLAVFEDSVRERFPRDPLLRRLGLYACAGVALRDAQGRRLGVLLVYYRERVLARPLLEPALRIFAARAAAEIGRMAAEFSLKEQASLLDKAHDAIFVRGIDDRIRFWNKGAERVFGWTADEAIGRPIEQLLCESAGCLNEALAGVMDAGVWSGNLQHVRKDGAPLTVAAHWTLVRKENGQPKSILCIATDITRRLAVERQLQQSQRLEAVGQLTGGVAHDFNNLLTVILGNAELLSERLAGEPRLHALANMIRKAAQRGADLTASLLAFARRQTLEPRAVDVNALVRSMAPLLQRTLPEDVELRLVLAAPPPWPARVDPAQLESALLNLCLNARDAMLHGGRLTVETAAVAFDEAAAQQHAELKPGHYVMVAVSDTGHGIGAEDLKHVFEPFFTTKGFGKGTGLGLSMVYGFVKQSQGHVSIYSEPGLGTTVKMLLPRDQGDAQATIESASTDHEPGGSETVLLVEDDDLVRAYAQDQLARLGYRVIGVRDGAEALAQIEQRDDIDLLFTDVVMPGGLSGFELAEAACRRRPGLKVLFTSGYTDNAIAGNDRFPPGRLLLSKPYRRAELAQKVRAALGGEGT